MIYGELHVQMYDHKGTVYGSSVVKVLFGAALLIEAKVDLKG